MVGHNPNVLWSVSFQLSFAAMAGIAVLAEPIDGWLRTRLRGQAEYESADSPALATVSVTAAMTAAATVATLPLVAFYFQRVSLVGLPATVLALPALPLVLVTQALAGVVGLVATPAALPLGWLAWVATGYMTGVVGLFAALPSASLETGRIAPLLVWAYYGVFAMWPARRRLHGAANWALPRLRATSLRPRIAGRGVPWWALVTAVSVAALVWAAALSLPDGRLHVTFADVGQGDAVLITTPGGQRVLIDGGPDPVDAARLLGASLPFWDRSIELVVLTHPHSDHVTGLTEALRRYQVHSIVEREVQAESLAYREWRQAVEDEGRWSRRRGKDSSSPSTTGYTFRCWAPLRL